VGFARTYETPAVTRQDITLWSLRKDARRVKAVMRVIDHVGTELRFLLDGELHMGQLFKPGQGAALEKAAQAKRTELEARGWSTIGPL
jgi:hypothetical protein